jgi:hypothetical protein
MRQKLLVVTAATAVTAAAVGHIDHCMTMID